MRVISGKLKGRQLKGFDINGTRPTMDRVKESLFAMIQDSLQDAICLDLFAGSGALGIEAISNGAKYCYFIDNNKIAIDTIQNNINNFSIEKQCTVKLEDYNQALINFKNNGLKFNLIFIDPPYKKDIIGSILDFIGKNDLLDKEGQVICEFSDYQLQDEYSGLISKKERKYSDKNIKIYNIND